MKQNATIAMILIAAMMLSGCGTYNWCAGETIRPGMSFDRVYRRMGKPDVGFGLPQKNTTERSWLYYRIPFNRYLLINFVGYTVDDPPTSTESRRGAIIY